MRQHLFHRVVWVIVLAAGMPPSFSGAEPSKFVDTKLDADLEQIKFIGLSGIVADNAVYPKGVIAQSAAIGTFTLRGPIAESLRPLPLWLQGCAAIDTKEENVYIPLGWLNRVSVKTGESVRLVEESVGRVPMTQLTSLAFDTRRRQMLVLDREGWQYRYDVDAKRWIDRTRAWEPQGKPVPIYAPDDDVYYMLTTKTLAKFNPDGDFISSIDLPEKFPLPDDEGSVFAAVVKGSIVAITPAQQQVRTSGAAIVPVVYVLDPASGKLRYFGPMSLRTSAGKSVGFVHRQWWPDAREVSRRLDDLSTQIAALAAARQSDLAQQLRKRLDEIRKFIDGADYAPLSGVPQVHAVTIYEARDEGKQLVEDVPVQVAHFGRPITLVLGAVETVRWKLSRADGACVERVILLGRKASRVQGLPKDTTVIDLTGPRSQFDYHGWPSSEQPWDLRFMAAVRSLTGEDLVSVTCKSTYTTKDPPLAVTIDNPDFRHRYALAAIGVIERELLLAPLRDVRFRAIHRTLKEKKQQSYLADFTVNGPVPDTLRPLSVPAHQLAVDERDGRHYVLADNKPYEIDPKSAKATPLGDPWDTRHFVAEGLACDVSRNRLVAWVRLSQRITDSGNFWGNRLYVFDLTRRTWKEASRTRKNMGALAHDSRRDLLYTLNLPENGPAVTSMSMLNAHAASLDAAQFSHAFLWHPRQGIPQIMIVRDRLIVITPPQLVPTEGKPRAVAEIYVVDPRDGRMARACAYAADR